MMQNGGGKELQNTNLYASFRTVRVSIKLRDTEVQQAAQSQEKGDCKLWLSTFYS
jgi:hypothetical protein